MYVRQIVWCFLCRKSCRNIWSVLIIASAVLKSGSIPAGSVAGCSGVVLGLGLLFFNVWLLSGKVWEARSRLYRRQILQVNTRLKALDGIYNFYTRLHPANPRHTFAPPRIQNFGYISPSIFACLQFHSQVCIAILVQNSPILVKCFGNFCNSYGKDQHLLHSQVLWDFATNIFEMFRKWFSKS